jgi:hypothetical protein
MYGPNSHDETSSGKARHKKTAGRKVMSEVMNTASKTMQTSRSATPHVVSTSLSVAKVSGRRRRSFGDVADDDDDDDRGHR